MSIIILPDVHHPFASQEALNNAYGIIAAEKPDYVVQIGDLYDLYSFSKFPRNPNFITPQAECELGRERAQEMWDKVKKASPKSKRVQLKGNHDVRPIKYVADNKEAALHVLKKYVNELMTFDGVELVDEEHVVEGIVFQHGHLKDGAHAIYNQQSTCVGHSHRPGVLYFRNRNGPYFELNAGCLIDLDSEAFSYRVNKKTHKMTLSIGMVDDYGPRAVLL